MEANWSAEIFTLQQEFYRILKSELFMLQDTFRVLPTNHHREPFLSQSHDRHVDSIVHSKSSVTFLETPFRKIEHPDSGAVVRARLCPLRRRTTAIFEPRPMIYYAESEICELLFRCGLAHHHLEHGLRDESDSAKGASRNRSSPAVLFVEGNFAHAKINRKFSRSGGWKIPARGSKCKQTFVTFFEFASGLRGNWLIGLVTLSRMWFAPDGHQAGGASTVTRRLIDFV